MEIYTRDSDGKKFEGIEAYVDGLGLENTVITPVSEPNQDKLADMRRKLKQMVVLDKRQEWIGDVIVELIEAIEERLSND